MRAHIQFIAQHDDTPSIYRAMYKAGEHGFHHVGLLIHDVTGEIKRFNEAFQPRKIQQMDAFVEETAYKLIDAFIGAGRCDGIKQLAVPLPLIVIGRQVGVSEEDIRQIKAWTDAWVQRLGMMQTEAEENGPSRWRSRRSSTSSPSSNAGAGTGHGSVLCRSMRPAG